MIRLVAIQIALFLAPFAICAAVLWARRRAVSLGLMREEAPLVWLAVAGLVLMAVSLVVLAAFDGGSANGHYVPDRFENGHLVPGHIE